MDTSHIADVSKSTDMKLVDQGNVDTSGGTNVASSKRLVKKRFSKEELQDLILKYCESEYRSMEEIATNINKDAKYLKNKIVPEMIESNLLERLFPNTINHPNQKYKKAE